MCFYHGCDAPTFFTEGERTARKRRRCSDCNRLIHPGERYVHTAGKWEGDFSTYATCERCLTLRAAIQEVEEADGCRGAETQPGYGALFEQVEDWDHYADEFIRTGRLDALVLVPAPDPDWLPDMLDIMGYPNVLDDREYDLPADAFDVGGEG